ncbi:MAG: c-type cytochrome [Deltaproteobacteria bacterium]|nr:c-type cytochrome [Deltaproteobacteria bacterium]MBP7285563.1 c-type cytochrome [Nannocystaceae bacterium]
MLNGNAATIAALALTLLAPACGGNAPDAKGDAKTAAKADAKTAAKPDAKPDDKPDDKADDKADDAVDDGAATPAAAWSWQLPTGIHTPPKVPDDNPMSAAKVELGHRLFMDKRLSVDGSRSCYSCHQNELGNADGRAKALGPGNKDLPRNSPTIWNVGLLSALYWDGRAADLEAQGLGALKGGNMGLGDGVEAKAAEIGALPEYADAFAKAFGLAPGTAITGKHVTQALSAYERTLLCGDTAHDRDAQDEAAKRGWALFSTTAGCITCHAQDNFTDGLFHRTGIGASEPAAEGADLGRGKISSNADENFMFRTPTLRNVARTAPYFHDGSVATLEEAVRIMAGGGVRDHGPVDANLLDRKLTDDQIADLVAFLKSLDCPGSLEVIGDQKVDGIGGT